MSGICGIFTPDPDRSVLSSRVQAGLDAMVHRGRDGFSIYPDSNIALGHCLFDTGCNGMHIDQDGFAISFDGRLDNRDELLDTLRRSETFDFKWQDGPDKALLLSAYRQLGDRLPALLRGDFAFAVWDPLRSGLFLCRDHFGVKPLFWRQDVEAFHFASEIKGLQAMSRSAPFSVRGQAIAGFVNGDPGEQHLEYTAFQNVYRLLPGHHAWIDHQGFKLTRYWSLNPALPIHRRDAASEFRVLFHQAVERRTRATLPVGALLSGGIDSSSIVAMIGSGEGTRRLRDTPVFSLVFEGDADESDYIAAVESRFDFRAHRIDGSGVSAFDDCDAITVEQDQPIPGPNIATFRFFIRSIAEQSGVRVLLDGHGGDEVVSYGKGIFQEFAEEGRWLKLWHELGATEFFRPERGKLFQQLIRKWGLRSWRRQAGWLLRGRPRTCDSIRYAPDGSPRPSEQAAHLNKLSTPLFSQALEAIDHNAAAAGIEIRMPFMDVDLVSFCVTLPASEKWSAGVSRLIVRKALTGLLPDAVANRLDKFDFTDHVLNSLADRHGGLIERTLRDDTEELSRFADLEDLRAAWKALQSEDALDGEKFQQIWRAVALARWLELQRARRLPQPADNLPDMFGQHLPEAAE